MIDYETATRLDIICAALQQSTEQSQIAPFPVRARRVELALRKWELYHAQKNYERLAALYND